jgi:DNA polymerase-3 subunit delta
MIYLFHGQDKYRLLQRLHGIISSHTGAAGDVNISKISEKYDFNTIKNEAESLPFLSDKRLLVVYNVLKSKDKSLFEKLSKWLPSTVSTNDLVFIEDESPDQRTSLYKTLVKVGKVEAFTELKPFEAIGWIKEQAIARHASIDVGAATLLQLYCGSDLTRLSNEIDKLTNYNPHITKDTVDKLVDAGFFNTIFELTDALSEKKSGKALHLLSRMLDTGENEIYLVSMLARQVRNLLIVKDLSDHRLSESEIVGKTHMHPFVIKKSLAQSRNFTKEQLLGLHGELINLDLAMKSTNTDPRVLLTQFVTEMTI